MDGNRETVLRHMQICRFCLNPDGNLTNIYKTKTKNSLPLPLQLMACVAIEVFQNDGMPQLICDSCRSLAAQAYSFKTNCKKADDALKLFLATGTFTKPFTESDFENYLPKGAVKIRKVADSLPAIKKIKIEPEHQSDSDSQLAPSENSQTEGANEIQANQEASNRDYSEFNVELVGSTPKVKIVDVRPMQTDCFPCTECDRTFPLQQLLDLHMQNHYRQRNFECDECDRSFFSKYDLIKHKLTHGGEEEGSFPCIVCNKEFTKASNLRRHEKFHEDKRNFPCSHCNQCFLNRGGLVAHLSSCHSKKRPFTCEKCGKSFVFKQGLERHALVHSENKPHKCNYCEASFTSPIKLTRHVTSHAGLRPYPCKLCKRTFLLSHHLTRHMRSHYAAKTNNIQQIGHHKCDICSMAFRRKDSLINHSAIHSMVNLKCVICYTEFTNAQAVKDHITSHLSGLPFPCEKCDYSFDTKEQLEEHEMKHAEMEYEEQIEKEVVEEARAKGHLTGDINDAEDFDFNEFGGDHMGRPGEGDDEDDIMDDEDDVGQVAEFSIADMSAQSIVRRSGRTPKAKKFTDFLKDELDSETEETEAVHQEDKQENVEQTPQTPDVEQDSSQDDEAEIIKPIFRTEGTKVYTRKTPVQKPKILNSISADLVKTAPLSQINQPQVTTIENLGLTTKDLQDLPTEKYVDMKIGNKTVRVQKLVLTKQEMKAMAKQGKIRGNTVLIKNPGQLSSNPMATSLDKAPLSVLNEPKMATKTYKKKSTPEVCNATVVGRDSVIINDMIIDNINDRIPENEESTINVHLE